MPAQLSASELDSLSVAFSDLINYAHFDEPIDPLTYVAPDGDTCLHVAARRGDLRSVELLVSAGLDVNRQGDMGCTPLHYAKTKAIVDLLLAAGARTDIENDFGKSPIGRQCL